MIPTSYESERVVGIDHDAKHTDPDERPAIMALAQLQVFLDGTTAVDFAVAAEGRCCYYLGNLSATFSILGRARTASLSVGGWCPYVTKKASHG